MTRRRLGDVRHRHPAGRDPGGGGALLAPLLGGAGRPAAAGRRGDRASPATCCSASCPRGDRRWSLHERSRRCWRRRSIVAVALIVGGVAILRDRAAGEARPTIARSRRCPGATALGIGVDPVPVDDPRRQPLGRDDHGRAGAGRRAPDGGRIQLLPRHPDDARRDRARSCGSSATRCGGSDWSAIAIGFVVSFVVALVVIRWFVAIVVAPRLRAVRLVSDRRRQRRADLAAGCR